MKKFRVWGKVVGSKYLGEFEAATKKKAEEMALESEEASVRLCHQCSGECEDAEIDDVSAEVVKEKRK